MKRAGQNILAILVVVAAVSGSAWFKRCDRGPAPEPAAGRSPAGDARPGTRQPPDISLAEDAAAPSAGKAGSQVPGTATDPAPVSAALPRLVDLGANKCKQCKALAPILDALREEYKGRLSVEFIDVWQHPEAAEPYKIRLIPTQILYDRNGTELWRHEGFISKQDLKTLFAEKVGVK